MSILYNVFKKDDVEYNSDFKKAMDISRELFDYMNTIEIQLLIQKTHKTFAKSGEIQDIILAKAIQLGFSSEKKGLFLDYPSSGLRPDYYLKIGDESGIIMEVERGKTIANNMDILDLWKCHICKSANYLFLIVPQYRQTEKGMKNPIYSNVIKRISSFFIENNYINIDAVFIFGY